MMSPHREWWLARRRKTGRTRPRPLRVRVVNCMSVSTSPAHARAIFAAALDLAPRPDVVLASECADFRGSQVAGPRWRVVQAGALGSPESGCLVAVRRGRDYVGEHRLIRGSTATREGGGIRDRPILTAVVGVDHHDRATGWVAAFAAGHAPPPRAPLARAVFMRAFGRVHGIRGGDLNLPGRIVARWVTGARIRSVGVLALAVPAWIPSTPARRVPAELLADADHDGVDCVLWPEGSA